MRLWKRLRLFISEPKHGVGHPPFEPLVVRELLEQFRIVLEHCRHHARQRLVVLDAGVLLVGVLLGILVGRVRCHASRNVLGDELADTFGVGPGDIAELVVEGLDDVRESVQLRLGLVAPTAGRGWADCRLRRSSRG